ncbi:MAG: M23 family metallopeptidase [Candidatus Omnitrophota bacterium]|nr:M23 family metallopeptidase [Candidatus Omnitrophota bacterium]
MNWRFLFFTCLPLSALITATLHEPLSVAVYKLREPYFASPIHAKSGKLVIRNDALGDGSYGAKRRNSRSHSGIDIHAPRGTPVYAAKSGVAFCGNVPGGYGKYVMIYHPDGSQTIYAHLSNWAAHTAKRVRIGDLIGFVGNTGNASGKYIQPHLHFEIRRNGKPLDPQQFMK